MIYLFVSLLLLGIGYSAYYTNVSQYWLVLWAFLALFWGTSYIYAPDIPGYMSYFKNDTFDWFETGIKMPCRKFEWGFNVLSCVLRSITSHYYVYQFTLFAAELLLVLTGLVKLFGRQQAFIFTCLLFFILPNNLLAAMRQGIPIALFIFSLPYIKEQKLVPFVLLIVLGSCFHGSSIYLLPCYFLPRLYALLSWRAVLIGILIALDLSYLTHFSISELLIDNFSSQLLDIEMADESKLERYMNIKAMGEKSNYGIMKLIEINAVYVLYMLDDNMKDKSLQLLKLLFLIYFIINALVGGIFAHRVSYYFTVPYQLCVILSFVRLGDLIFRDRLSVQSKISMPGYWMVGLYVIYLNVFKFNNILEGNYIYRNLFIESSFFGID